MNVPDFPYVLTLEQLGIRNRCALDNMQLAIDIAADWIERQTAGRRSFVCVQLEDHTNGKTYRLDMVQYDGECPPSLAWIELGNANAQNITPAATLTRWRDKVQPLRTEAEPRDVVGPYYTWTVLLEVDTRAAAGFTLDHKSALEMVQDYISWAEPEQVGAKVLRCESRKGRKCYTVQVQIAAELVKDGFLLTDENTLEMLYGFMQSAVEAADEVMRTSVLTSPPHEDLLREQGCTEADIAAQRGERV